MVEKTQMFYFVLWLIILTVIPAAFCAVQYFVVKSNPGKKVGWVIPVLLLIGTKFSTTFLIGGGFAVYMYYSLSKKYGVDETPPEETVENLPEQ